MLTLRDRSSQDLLTLYLSEPGVECFEFAFPSTYSSSKTIRDFVALIFDHFGLMPPWRSRFILIIDELVNNAVAYGSLKDEENIFRLFFETKGEDTDHNKVYHVCIEVQDTGNGPGTKTAGEMRNLRDSLKALHTQDEHYMGKRGRGLFMLTEHIVDTLDFRDNPDGGLTVFIEKTITQSPL